uniref:Uncharacterized protein n=1 Tax=Oryza sativa subsp. japonica TaxID=39947 RepID=Q69KD7_ORYSJ|nr:hypothetical protein [Oryza sativa Japonica Group]
MARGGWRTCAPPPARFVPLGPPAPGHCPVPLAPLTTVLRVSIHCEGCKKVKEVLQNIEGVHSFCWPVKGGERCGAAQGDSGERCGNNALIRWLLMSGKHTTVWPSPPIAAVKKTRRGPWSVSSYYPPLPQISPVAYPPLSHFLRKAEATAADDSYQRRSSGSGGREFGWEEAD